MSKTQDENALGNFLKDRRTRLDAASLGYLTARRRTPGLRREEVAQRANVSITWYTWLEQGRGGAPSADLLERLADSLCLTEAEREHLFYLAQNRPPEVQVPQAQTVTPQLQRVLDALEFSPAYIRTSTWDIVAWNRAAQAVLGDFASLPASRRNMLYQFFSDATAKEITQDWEQIARAMVAAFRTETTRSGSSEQAKKRVAAMSERFPEFKQMWGEMDVLSPGGGIKSLQFPQIGAITFEYSTFAVDGKPQLSLIIFNPAMPADKARVEQLMRQSDPERLENT